MLNRENIVKHIRNRKAQSEMVGFALIVIIISVLIIIFVSNSIKKDDSSSIQDKSIDTFIQAFLGHTTICAKDYLPNYLSLSDVISYCAEGKRCYSGSGDLDPCDVMNDTLSELVSNSMDIGINRPNKGYSLIIGYKDSEILRLSEGSVTQNNKGSSQRFENGVFIQLLIYS